MVGRGSKRRNMNGTQKQRRKVMMFPDEIIVNEILPRLPVKALIRFKLVSKHWYSTISSPSFARLRLHIKNPHDQNILILDMNSDKETVFYSVNLIEASEKNDTNAAAKVLKRFPNRIRPYGICHGLLAFFSVHLWGNYIWNLSTGEHLRFSSLSDGFPSHDIAGFGYVSATNDYKVLVGRIVELGYWFVYSTKDNRNSTNVCRGGWRKCLHCSHILFGELVPPPKPVGVLVGEKLYWKTIRFVICFDLASEKNSLIPIPRTMWGELPVSQLRPWSGLKCSKYRVDNSLLCTLGGCLSLCVVDEYVGTFNVWKLMDPQPDVDHYSSLDSNSDNLWSKVVTTWCNSGEYLSLRRETSLFNPYVGFFEISDSGKFVMFTGGGILLLCDPMCNDTPNCIKLMAMRRLHTRTPVYIFQAISYVESLIFPLHVC